MQSRLFATGLALADPPRELVLERYNRTAATWEELPAQTVLMRWSSDKNAPNAGTDLETPLATSPTSLGGSFEAVEPFDVQPADRFTLAGMAGKIDRVWPVRNGRRRATFTLESDTRGMT